MIRLPALPLTFAILSSVALGAFGWVAIITLGN